MLHPFRSGGSVAKPALMRSALVAAVSPRAGGAHSNEELMSALLVGYARVSTHDQDLTVTDARLSTGDYPAVLVA